MCPENFSGSYFNFLYRLSFGLLQPSEINTSPRSALVFLLIISILRPIEDNLEYTWVALKTNSLVADWIDATFMGVFRSRSSFLWQEKWIRDMHPTTTHNFFISIHFA